jgi:RNA polymerase sigma factor (sigma-70 family)
MTEIEKQEKFLELIEPIRDKLYMYAMALERSSCDAEDLVGETLLACYEAFGNIEDHSSFKSYVFKTARNTFRVSLKENGCLAFSTKIGQSVFHQMNDRRTFLLKLKCSTRRSTNCPPNKRKQLFYSRFPASRKMKYAKFRTARFLL